MILCVGPNPAVDRSVVVPNFSPFAVNRATFSMDAAGGKGINVARAVQVLGGKSMCAGFLGGDAGHWVARLAEDENLDSAWTWIEGETRICTIIIDSNIGRATVVNENGPTVSARDWERLESDVLAAAETADCVCISGSLPPGSPLEAYAHLLNRLKQMHIPTWVDTSGGTLRTALSVPGIGIKVNHEEISAVLDLPIPDAQAALIAAEKLRALGADIVAVTLGAPGAVIATDSSRWWAQPPTISPVSAVGSGDSFMAGLVVALGAKAEIAEALRWAVAAGTANALSVGGARFDMADFHRSLSETTLISL